MASTATPQPKAPSRSRWGLLLNTIIVASGYLLSRVLGLIREIIFSTQFGTSADLAAYRATFGVLDLIYIVIAGGALGSAFIPVFSGLVTEGREEEAWKLASSVLNLAFVGLTIACLLIGIFAEPLVAASIGSGFEPEQRALTVGLLRLMLIQPLLLGLGGIIKATLESFDRFSLPTIAANIYNVAIIAGALLGPVLGLGIYGVGWGVVAGAVLFVITQLPGLRAIGMRYTPRVSLHMPELRQIAVLLGPRLFGQAAWQINMIAIISFASLLGPAPVAANGYALTLMLLPHGLIALSLGTVIFPQLSRFFAAGDHASFRNTTLAAVRQTLFLSLFFAVLFVTLAFPIIRLLFERGQFDADSSALATQALTFYALGLPAFAAAELVVRSFYAMKDTRTPVIVGMTTVAINIALGWGLLQAGAGLSGLALAFSITNTLEFAILLLIFGRRLGGLRVTFWRSLGKMLLATLVTTGVALLLVDQLAARVPLLHPGGAYRWPGDFLALAGWLGLLMGVCALCFFGSAALLRAEELRAMTTRIGSILTRGRR